MSTSFTFQRIALPLRSRRFSALLAATQSVLDRRGPAASAILLLEDVCEELERYLDVEDCAGDLAKLSAAAPRLEPRIAQLLRDRGEIRRASDELLDLARRARTDPEVLDVVRARFGALRDRLERCEREEDQLVRAALQLDFGGN